MVTITQLNSKTRLKEKCQRKQSTCYQWVEIFNWMVVRKGPNNIGNMHCLPFWTNISAIWSNIFCNVDKYILLFGQIYSAIWANTRSLSIEGWLGEGAIMHYVTATHWICSTRLIINPHLLWEFTKFHSIQTKLIEQYSFFAGMSNIWEPQYTIIIRLPKCHSKIFIFSMRQFWIG